MNYVIEYLFRNYDGAEECLCASSEQSTTDGLEKIAFLLTRE